MADIAEKLRSLGQIRLLDLPDAIPLGEAALQLEPTDVGFPDEDRSDASMLKEAVQNRYMSESFEAARGLISSWNVTEYMLRAQVEPVRWKGSDQWRSNLGLPILAEHFYSMLSVVQESLFGGYNSFMLDPTSGTDLDTAAAETALVRAQFKQCGFRGCKLKQEMRHVVYEGLLYGTGVAFYGWENYKQEIKKTRAKSVNQSVAVAGGSVMIPHGDSDDVESYVDHVIEFNQAKLEHVPLRRLRVDPSCRRGEIWTAGWAARIIYPTTYDLDRLRDTEGFNIPSREDLIKLTTPMKMDRTNPNVLDTQGANSYNPLFQSQTTQQKAYPEDYDGSKADPLAKNWECLDYWTPYRHVMILENQYVIYNQPQDEGTVPFRSFVFREAPDSFYGWGLGYWLTDYQRISQGICNALMDDINLNLMGTYTTDAGSNNQAQAMWIFPGKVAKTDPGKKIEALTRNSLMTQEPLGVIAQVKEWATNISGAGISAQGSYAGKAGDLRTPGAAAAVVSGENTKTTDLVDQICDNVLVPFIEYIIRQNHRLKPSQINTWLSAELGTAFKKVDPLSVLNGQYIVTVSAATRLRARQQLNTLMGFIQSIIQAPGSIELLGQQAAKIDFAEFVRALIDSTGLPYRENIIKPMTDEDLQRYAARISSRRPSLKRSAWRPRRKKKSTTIRRRIACC